MKPTDLPNQFATLVGIGAVRRFDEMLEKLPVERKGTMVRCIVEIVFFATRFCGVFALSASPQSVPGKNASTTFQRIGKPIGGEDAPPPEELRLKKLAAAFDAHAAEHALSCCRDRRADGTPLLSWRVALLPHWGKSNCMPSSDRMSSGTVCTTRN
ncbi:MAG: hypothetical protein U0792_06890 [Gemmataceae bacterium]